LILFQSSSNGIYVINAHGTGRKQLTKTGDNPVWSPEGVLSQSSIMCLVRKLHHLALCEIFFFLPVSVVLIPLSLFLLLFFRYLVKFRKIVFNAANHHVFTTGVFVVENYDLNCTLLLVTWTGPRQ
jgi:hypothetical protein